MLWCCVTDILLLYAIAFAIVTLQRNCLLTLQLLFFMVSSCVGNCKQGSKKRSLEVPGIQQPENFVCQWLVRRCWPPCTGLLSSTLTCLRETYCVSQSGKDIFRLITRVLLVVHKDIYTSLILVRLELQTGFTEGTTWSPRKQTHRLIVNIWRRSRSDALRVTKGWAILWMSYLPVPLSRNLSSIRTSAGILWSKPLFVLWW